MEYPITLTNIGNINSFHLCIRINNDVSNEWTVWSALHLNYVVLDDTEISLHYFE